MRNVKHNLLKISRYTIVEMMMVLAVFMIIMSMAMAAWLNSGSDAKLKNAVRLVNAQLNLARAKAVAERTTVGVSFDSTTGTANPHPGVNGCGVYYYSGSSRGDAVPGETWLTLPSGTIFTVTQPGSSAATPAGIAKYVAFDSKGRVSGSDLPSASGVYTFYVTSGTKAASGSGFSVKADESYFKVEINEFTGRSTTSYYEVND